MTIYQKTTQHSLKWVVALLVFLLVMGFTTNQVYGLNVPSTVYDNNGSEQPLPPSDQGDYDDGGTTTPDDECPPEIPEPITLILMGTGLGVLHLSRRFKKAQ
ncbi:MAG: hypothetical protein DRN14_02695 [Thermoplasmata archaeon]|nr:MAG: hypothetical protein DRN14_02695 [Thermoplasmata archaeon]